MDRIPTALCFDVEDIIAPESDDAVLWMADILHEHGLIGSFIQTILMLFRDGQVAKTVIGAYPKRKLEAELEPALA